MPADSPREGDLPAWLVRVVLIAIAALFLVRNLPWHLDDYDQAKQAFVSFEMVEEGRWWFQHTPAGRIATKPPLAGWLSAGFFAMTGGTWWDGAWRLPSLLSALLIVALLWRAGSALLGSNIGGLLAAGAFGLNVFSPRLATLVRTDMLLTFLIFSAGWLALEKVRREEPWTTRERWLVFACVLAAMLTKGPIIYAFLLPGLAAYALLARRFRLRNFAWSGWWPWLAPLLAFAAWAGIGMWLSPQFYEQVVLKEFLGRFDLSDAPVHRHQPFYFYLGHLLLRLTPWSLLLLAFALVPPVRAAMRRDPALLWLLCWSLGGLLLMSVVPSKRFDRILPVVPPLCLLLAATARHLPGFRWKDQPLRRLTIFATGAAFAISASYAAHSIWAGFAERRGALVAFGRGVQRATATRPERLAVISGKDEGMLLYTGRTRFTRASNAVEAWQLRTVDWLVLPERVLLKNEGHLRPFERLAETGTAPEKSSAYVFIRRVENATPPP